MAKYTIEDVQVLLGKEYEIGEITITRNFGNGFDLEIDNALTDRRLKYTHIYLRAEGRHVVRMIEKVPSDFKIIKCVARDLFEYSKWLCRCGLNTSDKLRAYSEALCVPMLFKLDFDNLRKQGMWHEALYAGIMVSEDGAKLRVIGFNDAVK